MKTVKQTAAQKLGKVSKKIDEATKITKLQRALFLQGEMTTMKTELDEIKLFFSNVLNGTGTTDTYVTELGTATRSTLNKYTIGSHNLDVFKGLFKRKLPDFVNTVTDYKPTAKLKALLLDGDYPEIDTIRNNVTIETKTSVTFKAAAVKASKMKVAN